MLRRFFFVVGALTALLMTSFAPAIHAQTSADLRFIAQTTLPNSAEAKFPSVTSFGETVHIGSAANRRDALYWTKRDSATTIGAPSRLGDVSGQPDYHTTSIAVGTDGTIYYVWSVDPENSETIYLRFKRPGENWSERLTVVRGAYFPVNPQVTVTTDNRLLVAWREPDRPIRYRISTDRGESWTSTQNLGENAAINSASVDSGPDGALAVAYTEAFGDRLQIYVSIWNGSSFSRQRITTLAGNYADPDVAYSPTGKLYVSWRGASDTGSSSGVFYSERQPDGRWPISRLAGGSISSVVSIDVDDLGNVHVVWIVNRRVNYAFQSATTGQWIGPIAADGGTVYNARASTTISDAAYTHVVNEIFTGSGLRALYSLFSAPAELFGAQPKIENDADLTRNGESVVVNFENVFGTPKEIQWKWNAPVSDNDNDSNGWQPYSNPMTIPLTKELRDDAPCEPVTLYTRVRNNDIGKIETAAKSDAIRIDSQVEAEYTISSPFTVGNAVPLSDSAELSGVRLNNLSGGRGDPNYTRLPAFYLAIDGSEDCSGVESFTVAGSSASISSTKALVNNRFDDYVLFPDFINARDGLNRFTMTMRDGAGNELPVSFSLVLDTSEPVLDLTNPGTITVTDRSPNDTLLVDIDLTDINLSDAELPGVTTSSDRAFWGVWVAVSRTAVTNPSGDSRLEWVEIETPGESNTLRIEEFSLASGLDDNEITSGTYFIYVRFLDRAGNVSEDALSASYSLNVVVEPKLFLPLVSR